MCAVAVEMLAVDGAVLTLRVAPGCPFVVGASSAWARLVKELAYTTGEGPGDTAAGTGTPVLVSDLTAETHRWPGFANAAIDLGVRASFAFPLRVGGEVLGALVLYRKHEGVLSASEFVDAGLLVDVAQGTLIELVNKAINDPDDVLGLEDPGRARWAVIHIAAGMIASQLETTTDEATSRLRPHAFAEGRSIVEVAQDVIDRRLRFD